MIAWLTWWLPTLAIEVPLIVFFFRVDAPMSRRVLTAVAANAITHPVAWLLVNGAGPMTLPVTCAVELLAVVVEAAIYSRVFRTSALKSTAASLIANGLSFTLCLLVPLLLT